MKVLVLAPLWYPISRDAPGGIETFLYRLVSALQSAGHQVTMLAAGDSTTDAELVPVVDRGLYAQMAEGAAGEYVYYEQHQLAIALHIATEFDIIHSHIGPGGYVLDHAPALNTPVLHTVHVPVYSDMEWYIRRHPLTHLVTVSQHQMAKLQQAGAVHCTVVPNGIDSSDFTFNARPGSGLLFLGRIEAAKGPELAISVARSLGLPLTLAGPIVDRAFFKSRIEPLLGGGITYVGVADHAAKNRLLGEAACALLPFRQAEPFGMVSIEAMACGTPVVALANGALPEIVEPGITGYLAADESALDTLTVQGMRLDRSTVRERAIGRFEIDRTAAQYIALYQALHEQAQNSLSAQRGEV
jgi:glycosyltransferase involved in cell wall biosynthesis